jgi:hypothetical protein
MSSPKAAAKPARRPTAAVKPRAVAAKAAPPKPKAAPQNELSGHAIRLAGEIEREFAKTDDAISVEAMQTLMGTLCRIYSTQVDNGATYTPVKQGQSVSPTAIIHTASALLRAGNLSVYELGFWQNATGR